MIIMWFLLFLFSAAGFVATALPEENLFADNSLLDTSLLDNSLDMSISPDSSGNLVVLQDLSEKQSMTDYNNNENLFSDSGADDFLSMELQDPSVLEVSSCSTNDGQSLNKLRSRDGTFCSEAGSGSAGESSLSDPLAPLKDGSGFTSHVTGVIRPKPVDIRCFPTFPVHLCCEGLGRTLDRASPQMPLFAPPGLTIYRTVYYCIPGTS